MRRLIENGEIGNTTFIYRNNADGNCAAAAIFTALPACHQQSLQQIGGIFTRGEYPILIEQIRANGPIFYGVKTGGAFFEPLFIENRHVVFIGVVPKFDTLMSVREVALSMTIIDSSSESMYDISNFKGYCLLHAKVNAIEAAPMMALQVSQREQHMKDIELLAEINDPGSNGELFSEERLVHLGEICRLDVEPIPESFGVHINFANNVCVAHLAWKWSMADRPIPLVITYMNAYHCGIANRDAVAFSRTYNMRHTSWTIGKFYALLVNGVDIAPGLAGATADEAAATAIMDTRIRTPIILCNNRDDDQYHILPLRIGTLQSNVTIDGVLDCLLRMAPPEISIIYLWTRIDEERIKIYAATSHPGVKLCDIAENMEGIQGLQRGNESSRVTFTVPASSFDIQCRCGHCHTHGESGLPDPDLD